MQHRLGKKWLCHCGVLRGARFDVFLCRNLGEKRGRAYFQRGVLAGRYGNTLLFLLVNIQLLICK